MSKKISRTGLTLGEFFFHNLQKGPADLADITLPPEGLREHVGNFYVSATETEEHPSRYNVSVFKEFGSSNSTRLQAEETFNDFKKALTAYYWAIKTLRRLQCLGETK